MIKHFIVVSTLFVVSGYHTLSIAQSTQPKEALSSRQEISEDNSNQRGKLISANLFLTLPPYVLNQIFSPFNLPKARHAVRLYRLTYYTIDLNGQPIRASGLLAIPVMPTQRLHLIALQHGTITSQNLAPSVTPREGVYDASQGFMVVVQDYLGFGESAHVVAPYLIEQSYVNSGIDMIRAARNFAAEQKIEVPGFFLKGYSEGGYASLAIQKAIETRLDLTKEFMNQKFQLIASAPGAGPYILSLASKSSLAKEKVNPVYITKMVRSYRNWYPKFSKDYQTFFQASAFGADGADSLQDKIEKVFFNGSLSVENLMRILPGETQKLVQPDFREQFLQLELDSFSYYFLDPEQDRTKLAFYLQSNNLVKGWAPRIPTRFYHCAGDETIRPIMTGTTIAIFKRFDAMASVSSEILSQTPTSHATCPAIFSPVQWFASLLKEESHSDSIRGSESGKRGTTVF